MIVTGWGNMVWIEHPHGIQVAARDRRGDHHRGIPWTHRAEDRARSRDQICRVGTVAARQIQLEADIRVGPPQRHRCCAASRHPDVEPVNAVNAVGRGRHGVGRPGGGGTGLAACGVNPLGAAGLVEGPQPIQAARIAAASQGLVLNATAHLFIARPPEFIALPPDWEAGTGGESFNSGSARQQFPEHRRRATCFDTQAVACGE